MRMNVFMVVVMIVIVLMVMVMVRVVLMLVVVVMIVIVRMVMVMVVLMLVVVVMMVFMLMLMLMLMLMVVVMLVVVVMMVIMRLFLLTVNDNTEMRADDAAFHGWFNRKSNAWQTDCIHLVDEHILVVKKLIQGGGDHIASRAHSAIQIKRSHCLSPYLSMNYAFRFKLSAFSF